jgi:HAD superfamily hydrolase (TIGR01509 family)
MNVLMPPKAAIFDFDGVLNSVDYAAARAFFEPRVSLSLNAIGIRWEQWLHSHHGRVEDDELFPRFWDELSADMALPANVRQELRSFHYMDLFQAFPDARPALCSLRRRGVRIAVLSNSLLYSLHTLLERSQLADMIDVALVPQIIGHRKPTLAAYRVTAERLGMEPCDCSFFDDEPANVEGALAVGMKGYLVDRSRTSDEPDARVVCDLSNIEGILWRS